MIALNAKNKMKLVNGDFPEPAIDSHLRPLWERNNDMLISWILNTVSEQIGNNLNFINYVSKLWVELQEHYVQIDGHMIFQLTNNMVQLKQENCSIEVYYHKLKGFQDEYDALEAPYMCTCVCNCNNGRINGERDQRKRLIQFLMGLDESYSNIIGQILLMQPLPSAAKVYTMVRQEEKQREGSNPKHATATNLNSYTNQSRPSTSYSQRQPNPNTNSDRRNSVNPNTDFKRKSTFRKGVNCGNCRKEGHYQEECYKIVGYPVGYPL
ncbi:cysteine-rich receptor-like protein kinase 8 [Tanacetum coccineum]